MMLSDLDYLRPLTKRSSGQGGSKDSKEEVGEDTGIWKQLIKEEIHPDSRSGVSFTSLRPLKMKFMIGDLPVLFPYDRYALPCTP